MIVIIDKVDCFLLLFMLFILIILDLVFDFKDMFVISILYKCIN